MSSNFNEILAASRILQERFQNAANWVCEQVETVHGVKLNPRDCLELTCVKNSVLGADDDFKQDWVKEVEALSSVKQSVDAKRLQAALVAVGSPENQAINDKLSSMKPDERLAYARAHGLMEKPITPPLSHTAQETAALIIENAKLRGGTKIAHARANGLV